MLSNQPDFDSFSSNKENLLLFFFSLTSFDVQFGQRIAFSEILVQQKGQSIYKSSNAVKPWKWKYGSGNLLFWWFQPANKLGAKSDQQEKNDGKNEEINQRLHEFPSLFRQNNSTDLYNYTII